MKKVISNKRKMTIRKEDDSLLFLMQFIKSRVQHKWACCDPCFPVHIHVQVGLVDYQTSSRVLLLTINAPLKSAYLSADGIRAYHMRAYVG